MSSSYRSWDRGKPREGVCDSIHVVPCNDLKEHVVDDEGSCWCEPDYDEEDNLYIHNSADGRERYENGTRQLN
jgi:hypothetical protein